MKQYIFTFILLLSLAACTEKEIDGQGNRPGPKTGLALSAHISGGQTATRALGDPFQAGLEEKRIDRIAFFVHTEEDGFQVYPPVPDADAGGDADAIRGQYPNHVYLSGTPANGYTAQVTLTAGGGCSADIIAIANLPHDYDYKQIVTWEGLLDSVALTATVMPVCLPGSAEADLTARNAFVMYGNCVKELAKEENNPVSFTLQRLAARIDITNEAYVKGATPTNHGIDVLGQNGFLLTSARLLRAKPSAYLVPKVETPDVETTDTWAPLNTPGTDILYGKPTAGDLSANPTQEPDKVEVANVASDATLQYAWHSLYTYPNDDVEHAPTSIEIKGWFRNTEITRRIPFVNKDGSPFALVGNHRYLVRIRKAPGQTDLSYSINVAEWDAADTINVKPDQTERPILENIESNGVYYLNNDGRKTFDIDYSVAGSLTFDALCRMAAGVRVKYYDNSKQTWYTDPAGWLNIQKSAEELEDPTTRAEQRYRSSFKATFAGEASLPLTRRAMLLIHNGGSEVEADTIFVRHVVTYPGTDLEPIAFGKDGAGKDIVWAPVNVGGTVDLTTVGDISNQTDATNPAISGYLYQWGRNVPLMTNPSTATLPELPNYLDACSNIGPYAGKYIILNNDQSWFKDDKTSSLSSALSEGKWPRQYQPCPAGWRVPTKAEWESIKATSPKVTEGKAVIDGTDGKLVLPAAGYISFMTMHSDIGVISYLHVNEYHMTSNRIRTSRLRIYSDGTTSTIDGNGVPLYAIPVRCVHE